MEYILFGASTAGIHCLKVLESIEYRVAAFTDNNPDKWGTELVGIPIISVDEAINKGITILISSTYKYEISKQLDEKDFNNYILDISRIISDLDETQRNNVKEAIKGFEECKINPYYCVDDTIIDDAQDDEILLVAQSYPIANNNTISDNFLSLRVKEYNKNGKNVSVFAFDAYSEFKKFKLHGTTVYAGDGFALECLIKKNNYRKLLIHFIHEAMIFHINRIRPETEINIWIHGVEAINWRRRIYNYTEDEISKTSKFWDRNDDTKMRFLKEIAENAKYKFVFVSEWMRSVMDEDANCTTQRFEIIPNFIDVNFFKYIKKPIEQRFNILKIKSFASKKYANDITSKTIIELSKRDIFKKMSFELYGDGLLFLEEMKELTELNFPNVQIYKTYLSHEEVYEVHKRNGIFLCPTRQDSQGVSMGEAMASGLVVVTNKVAAIPEFIDSSCGMLCENENFVEMADAIEKLCLNTDMFLNMSKKASERVASQCSYEQTIQRELDIID